MINFWHSQSNTFVMLGLVSQFDVKGNHLPPSSIQASWTTHLLVTALHQPHFRYGSAAES